MHNKKISDEWIKIFGVGFISLRNRQNKLNEAKNDIANKTYRFGDTIRNNNQNQQQQQQQPNSNLVSSMVNNQ